MLHKLIHKRGFSWYAAKTPWWLMKLYPNLIWRIKTTEKKVFLTFDDGPIPEVTEFVLNTLEAYRVKAHFFCIGKNVEENPLIYQRILQEGHAVGNHTHHHLNGWKTSTEAYLQNIAVAAQYIDSNLFRPPYGRITRKQIKAIKNSEFGIRNLNFIMWDVLSGDFDVSLSPEKCYENVIQNIEPGSIIVFHDSVKAFERLQYALPKTLDWLQKNNFQCKIIKKEAFE